MYRLTATDIFDIVQIMRICICTKQLETETNAFDYYAFEAAARIKDALPEAEITALSMGDDNARRALKEALAICTDKAYHIKEDAWNELSVFQIATVLSGAIKHIESHEGSFDYIFFGAKNTDTASNLLANTLASLLDIPSVNYALTAEYKVDYLETLQQDDGGDRIFKLSAPGVISFTKATFSCRYPSILRIMDSEKTDIPTLTLSDLSLDISDLKGGLILKNKKEITLQKQGLMIEESEPEVAAKRLFQTMFNDHVI